MSKKYIRLLLFFSLFATLCIVNACKKDDDESSDAVQLLSFGPSPVLRGGDLRFIGKNLDKVTAIVLADNVSVTSFKSKSAEQIVLTVPNETVTGFVVLKTPQGDMQTKTMLRISEPIALTSFSPAAVRPGDVVTIEGTYLNLIKEVIFSNKKAVGDTSFVSQTQTKIEVRVPDDAQSGIIVLSNGLTDPILVESLTPLDVALPTVTSVSPTPVKAGTNLTIEGTNLDLVKDVVFKDGVHVTSFVSQELTKLVVAVPTTAKDGPIKLDVASLLEVTSAQEVVLSLPTITSLSPNPVKNGEILTVQGTDLDLITSATFGGAKAGELLGGTATEITVRVPIDATVDVVTFGTAAGKSVTTTKALNLVKPTITGLSPTDLQVNTVLTITGTDLDLVKKVLFNGSTEADVLSSTTTDLTVTVPVGTESGSVTLVAKNGDLVTSSQLLTILASTSAVITSMPTTARPGDLIEIMGQNLDEVSQVIFPGNVSATMFGNKTESLIQVFVPLNATTGFGTIQLITVNQEIIVSPIINIAGVDPVADPTLVFFNFDDLGSWWSDKGGAENDPALTLDATNYWHVNGDLSGWTGFFWRNGQNNFPGTAIGTNVADYVLKFDINVLEPITGGEFAWRLKGSSGDFWYYWKPWAASGSYQTTGWITVTIPLSEFNAGGMPISDLSTITEDFGVAFNNGASHVNVLIDNVRFQHL